MSLSESESRENKKSDSVSKMIKSLLKREGLHAECPDAQMKSCPNLSKSRPNVTTVI